MLKLGKTNPYQVIVVGAGHAGCEAALACARMGLDTLIITGNLDTIAQMSCNPAIGGLAKGQIVREIDALGGEMALNADATGIQFKLLNASKGPAVQSPRAQCDKKAYQFRMKLALERQNNLSIFQAKGTEVITEKGRAVGMRTNMGADFYAEAVILTTGTFLRGLMHVGFSKAEGGRMGDFSSNKLSKSLKDIGLELDRLKTGTPARILGKSIDFSKCAVQEGDKTPQLFAFYDTYPHGNTDKMFHVEQLSVWEGEGGRLRQNAPNAKNCAASAAGGEDYSDIFRAAAFGHFEGFGKNQLNCYETHTTQKTAEIIRANLEKSAMYGGEISGIGPRYCPSIEDKIVRFSAKETHRLFLEPEGRDTDEWYINGLSTSMPVDVQREIVSSVIGLENALITRPAYAVEYDFAPPTQLFNTLESKIVEGLFCAGQINGTSGYEEAAGQGLVAGINAAAKILGIPPLTLARHESYIGVLIDDLATKGTKEPYRMFTSRAEYRLLLNHTGAECRLFKYAQKYGLLGGERAKNIAAKISDIEAWVKRLENSPAAAVLRRQEEGARLEDILSKEFFSLSAGTRDEVLYRVIYKGYLERDLRQIEKMGAMDGMNIPADFDYAKVSGLRLEAAQKLEKLRPSTLGQASRISGVSPADINVLSVAVRAHRRSKE